MKKLIISLFAFGLAFAGGCYLTSLRVQQISAPRRPPDKRMLLEVTAYCPCASCCGWKRDWLGRPVFAYGPLKGKSKRVGVTASGTHAAPGTIAADTDIFPFGTIMHVPGYGYGRVEDRGGAIKGDKIDLFFRRHNDALSWGRRNIMVDIWLPR